MSPPGTRGGPRVVALGGGHGLAAALRAIRCYAATVTAVVSVADDGGSSGRLRSQLGIAPPGDVRKCLVALADAENPWGPAFEHRFADGDLAGHAFGNLVIAGLAHASGDFSGAVHRAAALLGVDGSVVPAADGPLVIEAVVDGRPVRGQVAVMRAAGRVERVRVVPDDARAPTEALEAIAEADQVVLAPGSLFTSLLPVIVVPGVSDALAATGARVVQVGNLRPQVPETEGLSGIDHLQAVLDHRGRVDVAVHDPGGDLPIDEGGARELGVEVVAATIADDRGLVHDPRRLSAVLASLV